MRVKTLTASWFLLPVLLVALPASAGEAAAKGAGLADRLAATLSGSMSGGQLWLALVLAFMGGLLTALTPCVYPVIAITLRYFGGMQRGSQQAGRARVLRPALAYVGGMIVLYTTLGTLFASSGKLFGSLLANPWVVGGFALFSFAMALSMLGLFTLQLPAAWSTRLSLVGGKSMVGAGVMGLTSGVIAAPCTGPVLAVVLTVIASTGAVSFGFWLMLSFSLGLAAPFLLLAVTAGSLPAGGPWMEAVKAVLASLMAVVGLYFLGLALPQVREGLAAVPFGNIAGPLLLVAGLVVLGLLVRLQGGRLDALRQVLAVLLLTAGASFLAFGGEANSAPAEPGAPGLAWTSEHDAALAQARAQGRPVIIDFTADWCAACKELERQTFIDARVRAEAGRFVLVRVDATRMDAAMDALLARYRIPGLPAVVFVDSTGRVLESPRVTSFIPAAQFLEIMKQVR